MKKPILVTLSLMVVLPLMSCATTSADIIFDESLPLEQTAWINTTNVGTITNYNGTSVEWSSMNSWSFSYVQIPAGDTLLLWNVKQTNGNTTYTGKNMLFRYTFEAGKIYSFIFGRREGIPGFGVHSWDFEEKIRFDEEHFVEFVPFENASESDGRTVLE